MEGCHFRSKEEHVEELYRKVFFHSTFCILHCVVCLYVCCFPASMELSRPFFPLLLCMVSVLCSVLLVANGAIIQYDHEEVVLTALVDHARVANDPLPSLDSCKHIWRFLHWNVFQKWCTLGKWKQLRHHELWVVHSWFCGWRLQHGRLTVQRGYYVTLLHARYSGHWL